MNDSGDSLKPLLDNLRATLRERGMPETEINAFIADAAQRDQVVEPPVEPVTLDDLAAKLDDLQKAVEGIAAKLDAKDPA